MPASLLLFLLAIPSKTFRLLWFTFSHSAVSRITHDGILIFGSSEHTIRKAHALVEPVVRRSTVPKPISGGRALDSPAKGLSCKRSLQREVGELRFLGLDHDGLSLSARPFVATWAEAEMLIRLGIPVVMGGVDFCLSCAPGSMTGGMER